MSDCRKCADFNYCAEHEECGMFKPKTMTNADKIRSMTDEELAEWMAYKVECQYCSVRSARCTESEASCRANWLGWLREAKE